jgi:hypothetical protein
MKIGAAGLLIVALGTNALAQASKAPHLHRRHSDVSSDSSPLPSAPSEGPTLDETMQWLTSKISEIQASQAIAGGLEYADGSCVPPQSDNNPLRFRWTHAASRAGDCVLVVETDQAANAQTTRLRYTLSFRDTQAADLSIIDFNKDIMPAGKCVKPSAPVFVLKGPGDGRDGKQVFLLEANDKPLLVRIQMAMQHAIALCGGGAVRATAAEPF